MSNLLSLDPTPSATGNVVTTTVATTTTAWVQSSTSTATYTSTSCPNKNGVLVGASVGAAVGGFIIAVLASCLFMRRFKLSSRNRKDTGHGPVNMDGFAVGTERQSGRQHEMDTKELAVTYENRATTNVSELPQKTLMHEIDSAGPAEMKGS